MRNILVATKRVTTSHGVASSAALTVVVTIVLLVLAYGSTSGDNSALPHYGPPGQGYGPPDTGEQIQNLILEIQLLSPGNAADVLENVAPEVAAAALEGISNQAGAEIMSRMNNLLAAPILEAMDPRAAADIMNNVAAAKAADIFERVDPQNAATVFEEMVSETTVAVIEQMNLAVAISILSNVTASTGADIIEGLPLGIARFIIDRLEPEVGGAFMGEVNAQTRIGLINILSEESLTNILPEIPVEALLELPLQTLFDRLPKVPASSLAIKNPPPVDPNLFQPVLVQLTPTLAIYESQTGELTWVTLVSSPEPVDQILGKFARALSRVTISVENVSSKPAGIPELPDGQSAIEYFRVSMEGAEAEDLLAAHITFFVLKDVLETNNFHKWSVLLNRFDEASGQWVTYDATRVREDDEKVFYSAVVPGFSLFAISGDVEPTPIRFQVSELTVSPAQAREGEEITIQASVRNVSAEERTFQANLWLNNTIEATQAVVLGARESQTVTFTVTGDTGTTEVRIDRLLDSFSANVSDLNNDQVVDVRDAAILASAFNTSQGQAAYLSAADLNGDGVIDLRDLAIMAANFGRGG